MTGCPACGSNDYVHLELLPGSAEPDDDGLKRCGECGEEWV